MKSSSLWPANCSKCMELLSRKKSITSCCVINFSTIPQTFSNPCREPDKDLKLDPLDLVEGHHSLAVNLSKKLWLPNLLFCILHTGITSAPSGNAAPTATPSRPNFSAPLSFGEFCFIQIAKSKISM